MDRAAEKNRLSFLGNQASSVVARQICNPEARVRVPAPRCILLLSLWFEQAGLSFFLHVTLYFCPRSLRQLI